MLRCPLGVGLGGLTGALLGLGGVTLDYAEGTSYLSAEPSTCANCHIMEPQYASWQRSGHSQVATCNDCHLPGAFVPKWIAKARNGWNHSVAFTLQNFPEPIRITAANAAILEASCRRCHAALIHETPGLAQGAQSRCVHCHRSVGHGPAVGLGGPWDPAEAEEGTRALHR